MWKDHPNALKEYFNLCVIEWEKRGYKNNMIKEKIRGNIEYPKWLGKRNFHSAHKSNLLRKDPVYYSKFNWTEPDNLEYIWPN